MKDTIVFDFDGVIVDSLLSLKNIYLLFLKKYGVQGSDEEFSVLNGPSLPEIVNYLKDKYELPPTKELLLEEYKNLLASMYDDIKLIEGIDNLLVSLSSKFSLSLVSSCSRRLVEKVLKQYRLYDLFHTITTGDEVERSKPYPDIYLASKEVIKGDIICVIEDSTHGVESASSAGLKVIQFLSNSNITGTCYSDNAFIVALTTSDVMLAISFICENRISLNQACKIEIVEATLDYSEKEMDVVNQIWDKACKDNSMLFNGDVLAVSSICFDHGIAHFMCYWREYKYCFSIKNCSEDLPTEYSLAVSGIVIDKNQQTLVGQRSNVSDHSGGYELVPSGGIDKEALLYDSISPEAAILKELVEEAGIDKEKVASVFEIGVLFDEENLTFDIGLLINMDSEFDINVKGDEYSQYQIINVGTNRSNDDFQLISTSRQLLELAINYQEQV